MIFEEEIDVLLERVIVHERSKLKERLAVDGLGAERVDRVVDHPLAAVPEVPRDVGGLAGGNLKSAIAAFD